MKTHFDVFNGDADGICALLQLRLSNPKKAILISGVKRDISLLKQVSPEMALDVTVLDVALGKNLISLNQLLSEGKNVFYVDHHAPGPIPKHPALKTHIHTSAKTCTSLIVNRLLKNQFCEWAFVGAYGDNLISIADALVKKAGLSSKQCMQLMKLGTYLNYNAYGSCLHDLQFSPIEMYSTLLPYSSPFSFLNARPEIHTALENGYLEDNEKAIAISAYSKSKGSRVFMLPDAPWAKRISGVYSNFLANQKPHLAHAVIYLNSAGETQNSYVISIRAPLNNPIGADTLSTLFPTGGGRKSAAGINALPEDLLPKFIHAFHQHFSSISTS